MKLRLPPVSPDARIVVPGREVTYHEVPTKREVVRDIRGPGHDMRLIVIDVLTGVRARWGRLSVTDKRKIVSHLRSVADLIEKAIGGEAP
jgi:hypothetical protein